MSNGDAREYVESARMARTVSAYVAPFTPVYSVRTEAPATVTRTASTLNFGWMA